MNIWPRILLLIALYALFAVVETYAAVEPNQPLRSRVRNVGITLIFLLLGGLVTLRVFTLFSLPTQQLETHGLAYSLVVLLFAIFVNDFLFYWYHRAQHTSRWLWAIHELHHSETHLNATASLRTFWLENPIQALVIGLPVAYVTHLDLASVLLLPLILNAWLLFTHTNWRLHLGRLTPVICGPQLHRLHHSRLPEHRGTNFAQYFPIIDILFGTYRAPQPEEFPPTGTSSLPSEVSIGTAITRPFRTWLGTE